MKAILAGLLVGAATVTAVPLAAQSAQKITATGGWNLCVDVPTSGLALTIAVDGAAAVPAVGVTYSGLTAQIPLSQMPPSARTVGTHTVVVTLPSATVTLADGSIVTIPGGATPVSYEVISTQPGNGPTNPRWIKIIGTIAAILGGAIAAWLG